jgi:hypothetical protein
MAGKGVVFPVLEWPTYSSKDIDFSKFPHFEKLISLDLGQKIDPTVISFFYRDPVESIIYLHRQIKMPSQSTPDEWIRYLADENSRGVPIALPHDANQAGRYTLTSLSVRETFEDVYGLNVIQENIMNPEDVAGKKSNVKAYGVNRLQQGIVNGWFRIHESCKGFLDEARDYHIKDDGKFSDPDDHIDSARYGLLALEQGHGETILNRSASFAHKRLAPIEGKIQRI